MSTHSVSLDVAEPLYKASVTSAPGADLTNHTGGADLTNHRPIRKLHAFRVPCAKRVFQLNSS
jgi:hypothetical protein